VCTFFLPYSPSNSLFRHPHPHQWCQPSLLGRTCSALVFSDFVEEKS
jgi:hypothetical protein